jgi:hypothetical protein
MHVSTNRINKQEKRVVSQNGFLSEVLINSSDYVIVTISSRLKANKEKKMINIQLSQVLNFIFNIFLFYL